VPRQLRPYQVTLDHGHVVHLAGVASVWRERSRGHGRPREDLPRGGRAHAAGHDARSDSAIDSRCAARPRRTRLVLPGGPHVRRTRRRLGGLVRVGRIPYINCYPVYGAIDRGVLKLDAELVDGVPTVLNRAMASGALDVSVISAVEYARDATRYLLLPDLSICSDGPVRSVVLFSKRPATELHGRRVLVSRSSMTSVALLELLFNHVWK